MKRLFVTLLLMTSFIASGIAYDFSAVCESGQMLYYTIIDSENRTVELVQSEDNIIGNLIIPAMVRNEETGIDYSVVSVCRYTFRNSIGITGVVFREPSSLTNLKPYCFDGCKGIRNLQLPASLELIGNYAFQGCIALTSVTIPNKVSSIGDKAFSGCINIESVELPNSLLSIGSSAFSSCTSLKAVIIPNSVTKMDNSSFSGCKKMEEVVIGNSVEEIGKYAFKDCIALKELEFIEPSSTVTIDSYAFNGCNALMDFDFPSSLQKINGYAFATCVSLNTLQFPDNLALIDDHSFSGCSGVIKINLPNSLKNIGSYAFDGCISLEYVNIPNSVIELGSSAFSNCNSLNEAVIGNAVTAIGSWGFKKCSNLVNVTFGSSLVEIGDYAFDETNLQSMTVKAVTPPVVKSHTFQGVSRDIPIIIPCGSLERYQNKDYWNEFTNFTEDFVLSFDAMSENEELGTVNIIKEPITCDDMTVEVEAFEKNGSVFKGWEANGMYVSSDNPYSFTLEEDIVLVARFSGMGLEELEKERINVYPNPSNGTVTIDGLEVTEVQVYNALGQLVKETKEKMIDLSEQEAGTYILKVITPSGVVTKQIVKK